MQELSLNIKRWVAWLPGIDQCDDWALWSLEKARENNGKNPDISFIPAMTRRRLSPATRIALKVAHDCLQNDVIGGGVFCSRHGECQRTLGIYKSLAQGNSMSPTQFSQSVHNTAAGVFSIENDLQNNFCSIAAGPNSGEQGFIEAVGLVKAGLGPVLWVMSDAVLDAPYSQYCKVPELPFGIAMLLGDFPEGDRVSLSKESSLAGLDNLDDKYDTDDLRGTDNLLALLSGKEPLALTGSNGWRWSLARA